jgi:isocitrate lyase
MATCSRAVRRGVPGRRGWRTQGARRHGRRERAGSYQRRPTGDDAFDPAASRFLEAWEEEAGLESYGEAVAEVLEFRAGEGEPLEMSAPQWRRFAERASLWAAKEKARTLGVQIIWDCEHAKTPEGYYQIRGGIPYAIAKSLGAAPFADLLWLETKTADLDDARRFADAIHAVFPDKMMADNLSPSFNWDFDGMSDEEMQSFPKSSARWASCLTSSPTAATRSMVSPPGCLQPSSKRA